MTFQCAYCKKVYDDNDITNCIIHLNGNCLPRGSKK